MTLNHSKPFAFQTFTSSHKRIFEMENLLLQTFAFYPIQESWVLYHKLDIISFFYNTHLFCSHFQFLGCYKVQTGIRLSRFYHKNHKRLQLNFHFVQSYLSHSDNIFKYLKSLCNHFLLSSSHRLFMGK